MSDVPMSSDSVSPELDPEIHRALGLTDDEAARIVAILGRNPNHLELAMYSVMWSEHCSYKSSKIHLKRLPTEGERGPMTKLHGSLQFWVAIRTTLNWQCIR